MERGPRDFEKKNSFWFVCERQDRPSQGSGGAKFLVLVLVLVLSYGRPLEVQLLTGLTHALASKTCTYMPESKEGHIRYSSFLISYNIRSVPCVIYDNKTKKKRTRTLTVNLNYFLLPFHPVAWLRGKS